MEKYEAVAHRKWVRDVESYELEASGVWWNSRWPWKYDVQKSHRLSRPQAICCLHMCLKKKCKKKWLCTNQCVHMHASWCVCVCLLLCLLFLSWPCYRSLPFIRPADLEEACGCAAVVLLVPLRPCPSLSSASPSIHVRASWAEFTPGKMSVQLPCQWKIHYISPVPDLSVCVCVCSLCLSGPLWRAVCQHHLDSPGFSLWGMHIQLLTACAFLKALCVFASAYVCAKAPV